jgi:glycosyltransferase involved in cell wall biosynthesis
MEAQRGVDSHSKPRPSIAVVIPAFKVTAHIEEVVRTIPNFVTRVYVVDDACPNGSGKLVEAMAYPRVMVVYNARNLGVGGAVMAGYAAALEDGHEIIVKIDGDAQMDPVKMQDVIAPIIEGEADYTKGNRFYDLTYLGNMPKVRIVGNAMLSFLAKASTGYWDILDPTNGYTAIHAAALRQLDMRKISTRYFFETDILFRLNLSRAVVVDVPVDSRYGDEISNLKISRIIGEFAYKHARNAMKRVFYNYFLRDFTIASIELIAGALLIVMGMVLGISAWVNSTESGVPNNPGTVMLAALPVLLGLQLVLAFLSYDMGAVPRRPLQRFGRFIRLSKSAPSTGVASSDSSVVQDE